MLAAEHLFRRSESVPAEAPEWTIALGRRALGAEAYTLAVVGPSESTASFDTDHVFTQPSQREIATKLFTALAMVRKWSPNALVTVLFGDHAPELDVRRARELARETRDRVVVIESLACVGTVDALWDLGCAGAPALLELMETLVPMVDTDDEDAAIAAIYSLAPYVEIDDILELAGRRAAPVHEAAMISAA